MADLLLGIDIGTSSTKGVLSRADGEILADGTRSHRMSLPRPGWAEMAAESVWWGEVVSLSRELLGQADGVAPAAVCVSGMGPCLVVTGEDTRPLRDAILYGIDMRATAEIEELTERLGAERIVERGGKALSSQAVGPKLLWLQRNEPDLWREVRRWYSANGFAVARLTGEYVIDHHTASQSDPLYDIGRRAWAEDFADEVAPGLELPRLAWPSEVAGTVTAAAAAETGIAEGTPVVTGTVDAWAEAFAPACVGRATSCSCTGRRCSSCRCSSATRRTRRSGRRWESSATATRWPRAWRPPARLPRGSGS